MNPDEIDVMKLTPEDYLKMRDRCKELERDNILQQEHILELEHTKSELSATINRMHGGCERAIELRRLVDTLFDVGRDESVSDDEILRRMKNLRDEIARLQKENVFLYHQRNQLRNDKKQQADCILKLETELSQFRVAMKESSEKIEVLNDSLMKELANRQGALLQVVGNDADAYQRSVMRYAPSNIVNGSQRGFVYGAIGLCGEAGEASELVKKFVYHGHTLDYKHLAIELGDVLWYIAYTAYGLGYSLSNIMVMNQEKLAKRYPDGKFDEERSRNREEGDI